MGLESLSVFEEVYFPLLVNEAIVLYYFHGITEDNIVGAIYFISCTMKIQIYTNWNHIQIEYTGITVWQLENPQGGFQV